MASLTFRVLGKANIWGFFEVMVAENICEAWRVIEMGQVSSVENSWELNYEEVSFDSKNSTILGQTLKLI